MNYHYKSAHHYSSYWPTENNIGHHPNDEFCAFFNSKIITHFSVTLIIYLFSIGICLKLCQVIKIWAIIIYNRYGLCISLFSSINSFGVDNGFGIVDNFMIEILQREGI